MKNIIYLSSLIILLSSCEGSRFVNRKYTPGRFVDFKKTIKHNTIYSDPTQNYVSSHNRDIIKTIVCKEIYPEQESIEATLNSILKKDSIFIIRQKGSDKKIIIKNNCKDVIVYLNDKHEIISTKHRATRLITVDPEREKYKSEEEISFMSALALGFSLIPIIGFALAIRSIKLIKKYRKKYASERKSVNMSMSVSGLLLSIIPSLAFILFVVLVIILVFALLFTV